MHSAVAEIFGDWRRFIARTIGGGQPLGDSADLGAAVGTEAPGDTDRGPITGLLRNAARPERPTHILLLDDDSLIRRTTAGILRDAGHIVADPEDAESALRLFDTGVSCDLLIVDLSMPDMRGDIFATEARRRCP